MRLFTAVYPTPEALDHLDLALSSIGGSAVDDPGPGLRWLPREQRHVTLVFHGEVPDGAVPGYVDALTTRLAGVGVGWDAVAPFEVVLAGGGSFGGRTLWAAVTDGVAGLRACAAAARDAAVELGLRGEDRAGGRPHLTLARASTARGRGQRHIAPLDAWAHALAVYRGPAWQVTEVRVVHSTLGAGRSGGPLHEEVARIRLNSYG